MPLHIQFPSVVTVGATAGGVTDASVGDDGGSCAGVDTVPVAVPPSHPQPGIPAQLQSPEPPREPIGPGVAGVGADAVDVPEPQPQPGIPAHPQPLEISLPPELAAAEGDRRRGVHGQSHFSTLFFTASAEALAAISSSIPTFSSFSSLSSNVISDSCIVSFAYAAVN